MRFGDSLDAFKMVANLSVDMGLLELVNKVDSGGQEASQGENHGKDDEVLEIIPVGFFQ